MIDLPDETKDTLMNVLRHAASQEKAVVEFSQNNGSLYAKEITEHVEEMEAMINE